jgi:MHS family shikimate/dehydroshikimate transporter-like MFS transporter
MVLTAEDGSMRAGAMAGLGADTRTAKERSAQMRAIVWASVIGTTVEWYDFLIYGTAAALVFNKLFFPSFDPFMGTLAAFGSYAVGFVARPFGGAVFGHFGDRTGRKTMLTLTMLIMGAGTFLIGCLPTYASIGVWAPILLIVLRLLQGIGIGGEWGGAVLMVIEHAPAGRRGFYGSLVQVGFPLGVAASTGTFLYMSQAMVEADFLSWGWRLPFLLSAVLIGVGLFIRLRLQETPAFARVREEGVAKAPLLDVLLRQPRTFLIAVGMKVSEVAWVYVLTVFSIVYATTKLGLPRSLILNGILLAALAELVTIPLFGALSDRVGRKPLYIVGAILSAVLAFPVFWLLETRDPTVVVLTLVVTMSLTHGLMFGPQAAYMPELFGTRTRYSGASLGCQVSAALSGGFAPIIAAGLLAWAGATWPISLYLIALAAITLAAVLASRDTVDLDITRG